MSEPSQTLKYGDLVSSYYENLHSTLRNFSPGPEFLEDWVHDEDHNRSILGIFEAASNHGLEGLALEINEEFAQSLNNDWLSENLKSLGSLRFDRSTGGLTLVFSFEKTTLVHRIHPTYQRELSEAMHDLRHLGRLSTEDDVYFASVDGVTLACYIKDGLVKEAKHWGAKGAFLPLIDRLCDIILDSPLQEAAEHGTIRLERVLRNLNVPPPVQGLVTPDNADPVFLLPKRLIRDVYQQWRSIHATEEGWNDFDRPLSVRWQRLSDEEKIAQINSALPPILSELKIPYSDVAVLEIRGQRLFFARNDFAKLSRSGADLMAIERELKKRIEPGLDVVLEGLEDKNRRESRTNRDVKGSQHV